MDYYPIFLDIRDKPCVVVGGGRVAERKVHSLLDAGAVVTVVSPEATEEILRLSSNGRVRLCKKKYEYGDLNEAFLAFSATGRKDVNLRVKEEAEKRGILLNVVDTPSLCDFIVPSLLKRGALLIAISTSGMSPAMAKRIRLKLLEIFGEEYGKFMELMGAIRKSILKKQGESDKNKVIFETLADSPILEWIKAEQWEEIDIFLKDLLGEEYTTSRIGVRTFRHRSSDGQD